MKPAVSLGLTLQKFSIHDGPGIRTTVFFKGCPLRCSWCHNPESQSYRSELLHDAEKCTQCLRCLPHCPQQAITASAATDRNRSVDGLEAIFESGFREYSRLNGRRGLDSRTQLEGTQRAMRTTFAREVDGLERNLELLANIGSNAPYVGLVGTVFGIMVTMHDMISSGEQAGIASVAPGISEALFATAIGLFVAIPATWAYNRFTTRVERLSVRYETFAEEFSSILQRQSGADE